LHANSTSTMVVSKNRPTHDADNNTMSSTETASTAAAAASAASAAATTQPSYYSSPVIMVSGSTNIVHLTDNAYCGFLLEEHADAVETDNVQVQVETDDSGLNNQGSRSGSSSLSLPVVPEDAAAVPLVTDVQLVVCPVSPPSPSSSSAKDAIKRAHLSRVRTLSLSSDSSEEDAAQEQDEEKEDIEDIPNATACCVYREEWAWAGSLSNVETSSVSYSRPQIIFANAIKPTPDALVGLHFCARNGAVYIARISDDSIFRGCCNLQVGDRVVAVNGTSCIGAKNVKQVVKLLQKKSSKSKAWSKKRSSSSSSSPTKESSSSPQEQQQDPASSSSSLEARTVSIVVRNEKGDPRTVSTSIQKPDRFTRVGVALVNKRGSLKVTRIDPDSLFSNSLLLPRHRCLHINGMPCDHLGSAEAAKFILAAPDRVTIISQPHQHAAMVISASPVSKGVVRLHTEAWWRNARFSASSLAARLLTAIAPSAASLSSRRRSTPRLTACH
jgi:hypothetical protein